MPAQVSIVICTRNRAPSLEQTLWSIGRCRVPADVAAELLVVDNASTDDTAGVLNQTKLPNMPLRMLREQGAGKSRACNRALAEARGDFFLFTDDDVRIPADWIEGMCRPLIDGSAEAVAGGVVFSPELDGRVRRCRSWFASTEDILPDRPDRCVGANMSFSRKVLEKVPGFDAELGPGALGFGDETLFCYQLRQAGYRLIARFDVAVEHHFDPARLSRASMLDMAVRMGRCKAYVDYHWRHTEISDTKRQLWNDRMGLWINRVRNFRRWLSSQPPTLWELKQLESVGLNEEYSRQSRRERHYARFGLARL